MLCFWLPFAGKHLALATVVSSVDLDQLAVILAQETEQIATIQSQFLQEKRSGLLREVAASKGRFYFKKDKRMRWEVTDPANCGFVVTGAKARLWRGDRSQFQRMAVQDVPFLKVFTDQVFAWSSGDLGRLQQDYHFEILGADPVELKLTPIDPRWREFLDHIRILFSGRCGQVVLITVREADGDLTSVRFFDTRINEPLPDSLFE